MMQPTRSPGLRPTHALKATLAFGILLLGLAACAYERPQSTFTRGLDTGITSSDGGGTRALGDQPSVGVTTQVRP